MHPCTDSLIIDIGTKEIYLMQKIYYCFLSSLAFTEISSSTIGFILPYDLYRYFITYMRQWKCLCHTPSHFLWFSEEAISKKP